MSRDSINEYVGRAIRNLRQSQNITLSELAERLRLSYQQVQKYETGTNRVGADMLFEIAAALKTDVGMFFPNFQITPHKINSQHSKLISEYELINDGKLREIISLLINRLSNIEIV